jgi:hypothetical protein
MNISFVFPDSSSVWSGCMANFNQIFTKNPLEPLSTSQSKEVPKSHFVMTVGRYTDGKQACWRTKHKNVLRSLSSSVPVAWREQNRKGTFYSILKLFMVLILKLLGFLYIAWNCYGES